MKFRYECLARSRMAKHEVLLRVLRRQVTGKWLDEGGYVRMDKNEVMPALARLAAMRKRLETNKVKQLAGKPDFMEFFNDVDVGYDDRKHCHYVVL